MLMRLRLAIASLAALAAGSGAAIADEGMWPFNAIPADRIRASLGFAPDQAWLDKVQKSVVRLDRGCSGSVVSRNGLVLTNHHCISGCLQALSSPGNDLLDGGFVSPRREDERICPGAETSILQSITDVTDRVKAATAEVTGAQVSAARAAVIAAIESERCGDDRNRRCEVVDLYRGGRYALYEYDRYGDVRIAFAPESRAASFGGDPDNFNFPRYAFDMALLRLYRDGRPATFDAPLKLDPSGPEAGEAVFVTGHPGSTERLLTVAQLEFQRDHFLPWRVEYQAQLRGHLLAESTKGEEEARQVANALFGVENSTKVFKGRRAALAEPAFFASKVADEKILRDKLASDARLRARFGDPFADMQKVMGDQSRLWLPYEMLEARYGAGSVLLLDARRLVRAAAEQGKPDNQRLPEFTTSRRATLERTLLAEATVNPVLEKLEIAFWLNKTREYLGAGHPAVKALFGARSADQIAQEIVERSQLSNPVFRKRLWENPSLIASSTDPAIVLTRQADAAARAARSSYEGVVSGPSSDAASRIAALRFEVLGDSVYPDATFSLRLSYGSVKGWDDPVHGPVPAFTVAAGLWERATGAIPYILAHRWSSAREAISPQTQFNFVSTNDVIGGNSGSPVLDRQARVVGLVFDGNIHSLGGAYGFDASLNRTVSVSTQIILEALRKVYGSARLADELAGGS